MLLMILQLFYIKITSIGLHENAYISVCYYAIFTYVKEPSMAAYIVICKWVSKVFTFDRARLFIIA